MAKYQSVTITLPPPFIERIDSRRDKGGNEARSARMVRDLETLYSLLDSGLRGVRRVLTHAEAILILDVQNGTCVEPIELWVQAGEHSSLAHQVADGCDLDGVDKKWGVDRDALLKKLAGLSQTENLALVDWAAQFWGSPDQNLERAVEIFRAD